MPNGKSSSAWPGVMCGDVGRLGRRCRAGRAVVAQLRERRGDAHRRERPRGEDRSRRGRGVEHVERRRQLAARALDLRARRARRSRGSGWRRRRAAATAPAGSDRSASPPGGLPVGVAHVRGRRPARRSSAPRAARPSASPRGACRSASSSTVAGTSVGVPVDLVQLDRVLAEAGRVHRAGELEQLARRTGRTRRTRRAGASPRPRPRCPTARPARRSRPVVGSIISSIGSGIRCDGWSIASSVRVVTVNAHSAATSARGRAVAPLAFSK